MTHWFFSFVALMALIRIACAQVVPAQLPAPDGKAGNPKQPVKVYLLAGQSNMVGMGQLSGAKNLYSGMYFTADPMAPLGPMEIFRIGKFQIAPLLQYGPDGQPSTEALAEGQIAVQEKGAYRLKAGAGIAIDLDGHPAHKQDIVLEPGKRYPFKLQGFKGEAPRLWMQKMDLLGYGDLEAVAKREGQFPWLVDEAGEWTVRQDVYFQEARLAKDGRGSPLSPSSNGKTIGPELGFGHVLGTFHDEQVLLIKTAQGNRSLGFDFRPPSSGRTDPDNEFEAAEYRLMIEGARKTLDQLDTILPGHAGQGYELAGFAWFQGHKDGGTAESVAAYEQHLVHLIRDVRKEFKSPKLPVVVATVGFGGHNMAEKYVKILEAQLAVGDPEKHPGFAGTVASVDIRDFWREVAASPKNEDYHYNRNAETYLRIGDAMGRAMVTLQGGKTEPLVAPARPEAPAAAADTTRTPAQVAAGQEALASIIIDGIGADYIANPRYNKSLLEEAAGNRPQRANQFLRGAMFGLVNCYQAAGTDRYDWRPFGPDMDQVRWEYFSFNPPEKLPVEKGNRYRKVSPPEGMAEWFSPGFDPVKAGWRKGQQPFGQLDGALAPLSESCSAPFCGCGTAPKTLWEKEVLLMRSTLSVPALKEGHRYRLVLGGAAHVNSGEGYAIYINGKLLAESKSGVAVRQGGQPRGGHIYRDFRDEFSGGTVTIAATSFLRYNHPRQGVLPPRGHLSLWLEEAELPPGLVEAP